MEDQFVWWNGGKVEEKAGRMEQNLMLNDVEIWAGLGKRWKKSDRGENNKNLAMKAKVIAVYMMFRDIACTLMIVFMLL